MNKEEILKEAKTLSNRIGSDEDTLDYKNKSHVIEVNNFMVRNYKILQETTEGIKVYAELLGFLCVCKDYHNMKTFTHRFN